MAAAAPTPLNALAVANSRLTLERVIGITSLSNAMVAVNPVTGELAYAAGCIVVIYNLRRNKQVRYYRVEKSVACLCFSPSGQYLAIGEKGYLPAITIWDGTDGTLCAELQLHKFGVACMAFSRDGQYLLSAGLVHDQHLYAWDLRKDASDGVMRGVAVGAAQIRDKIFAMDFCQDGNFFVTVGEQHFKFWFLDDNDAFLLTGYEINGVPEIQHRDAVMSAKTDATFTGVACGHGPCRLKTFAVTSDGTLCCFGASCIMERLVSLEATHGNAISVTEAYVAVAGSSSIVRLFDPATLEYRSTMPFPPAFGTANEPHDASSNILHPDEPHRYPAVLAVRVTGAHVIVLYSDRSLFVYDVSDTQNARVERSFLCHSGCIRDLQVAGRVRGVTAKGKLVYYADDRRRATLPSGDIVPNGTFVTCSDDNTVRLWHLDLHKQTKSSRFSTDGDAECTAAWQNPFSHEMLCVVYHDDERDFAAEDSVVLGGTCSFDEVPDIHAPSRDRGPANGLRAVGIHPDQMHIVAGDKDGNLLVLELPSRHTVCEISAHNTEVHCIAFSTNERSDEGPAGATASSSRSCFMASGGRDRLVHVYDCSKAYAVVATLDNHSAAVTALQFTRDGSKLLSCGADRAVVLSDVHADGSATRTSSLPFSGGKLLYMALTSDGESLVTSCNNRLDVHSVATGKHVRTHHVGEQHRVAICPANYCVALSGSLADRTIHVVDLTSGETLADATGHGEAITAVQFTPDCRRLVSASSDGCIFVWRLPDELQSAIKSRLPRVSECHAPIPVPPPVVKVSAPVPAPAERSTTPTSTPENVVVLPPPAPPIAAPKALRTPTSAHSAKARAIAVVDPPSITKQSPSSSASSSSARRKSLGHTDAAAAASHLAALAMPKKSDAKDSRAWKSKAVAPAAGPMAKGPIEDWMRTRESAKRTVHVLDDTAAGTTSSVLAAPAPVLSAQLAIDRSQTPDWAKTIKTPSDAKKTPPAATAVRKSPHQVEAHHLAGEKWGKRAAPQPFEPREALASVTALDNKPVDDNDDDGNDGDGDEEDDDDGEEDDDPLFIKQQSGEVHQLDIPRSKEVAARRGSQRELMPSAASNDSVMHLSVGSLELKALGTSSTASSLALEREQLDRRRKQIETANAVAAMNSRLLQLGLLKPQRAPQDADSGADSAMTNSTSGDSCVQEPSTAEVAMAEESVSNNPVSARPTSEPIGAPESETLVTAMSRADIPEEMFQSIDLSVIHRHDGGGSGNDVDDDVSDLTHSRCNDKSDNATSPPLRVDESLSAFTSGFLVPRGAPTISSVDTSAYVSASISAFTSGYMTTTSNSSDAGAVTRSIALPAVDASLSQFTSGYHHDDDHRTTVPVPASALSPSVAASVRVDESLSAFTSGFRAGTDAAGSGVNSSGSASRASVDITSGVGVSMSAFTAGYAGNGSSSRDDASAGVAGVHESVSLPAVTASLSSFTLGYNSDDRAASSASASGSMNLVAASLSAFTSGYEHAPTAPLTADPNAPRHDEGLASQPDGVLASLSVFTAGYEVANQSKTGGDGGASHVLKQPRALRLEGNVSNNGSDMSVHQSLSAFTAGYEMPQSLHDSPASSTSTARTGHTAPASAAAEIAKAELEASVASEPGSPEATVLSTISDLDQQLVTVAKTFEDLLPTEKSAAPEVQEIQQLMTQLRAAIERFSTADT